MLCLTNGANRGCLDFCNFGDETGRCQEFFALGKVTATFSLWQSSSNASSNGSRIKLVSAIYKQRRASGDESWHSNSGWRWSAGAATRRGSASRSTRSVRNSPCMELRVIICNILAKRHTPFLFFWPETKILNGELMPIVWDPGLCNLPKFYECICFLSVSRREDDERVTIFFYRLLRCRTWRISDCLLAERQRAKRSKGRKALPWSEAVR